MTKTKIGIVLTAIGLFLAMAALNIYRLNDIPSCPPPKGYGGPYDCDYYATVQFIGNLTMYTGFVLTFCGIGFIVYSGIKNRR